jgi:CubicO group peptidase (beta-lactamase class C family)
VATHPELELHALYVLRDGAPVFEQYWAPYEAGDRPLVYSASKTFAATAVGLAFGEGRFSLDDRLVDLLADRSGTGAPRDASSFASSRSGSSGSAEVATVPEEPARNERASRRADGRIAELTVHHLLSMSTGHTEDTLPLITEAPPEQWAERFLTIRPQRPMGSWHVYNNGASFMLGELVRRHTGEDLLDYLRPRVLEPLGIDATWDRDPLGRCLGWTGLHVDVRGLAKLGELLRCDGVWEGRRLLPEGWVARATAKQIPTESDSPEWTLGYGYQVWMGREGYRLDGAYGQFAFVLPERGMVVAIQSAQSCTQVLIDLLWEHLGAFPLVEPQRMVEPVETAELVSTSSTNRVVELVETRLPVPPDSGLGTEWVSAGPVPLDPAMVDPGEETGAPADMADVRARRNDASIQLSLVAEGHLGELVVTPGEWRRQHLRLGDADVPVAVAAGADEAGDLHVRMVFTDTPHTLRLRLRTDGTAAQAWKVNPLQGPGLAAMRAH